MSEQTPRYLEDFVVGATDEFGRYEVTREEVLEFAGKYDPQPFHLDDEAAKNSIFGGLCASGWHTSAMAMRMIVDHMRGRGGSSLGSPGVDGIRWLRPVFPGDVLRMRTELKEVRPSRSRADIGSIHSLWTIFNQNDEPVMTLKSIGIVARRPKED